MYEIKLSQLPPLSSRTLSLSSLLSARKLASPSTPCYLNNFGALEHLPFFGTNYRGKRTSELARLGKLQSQPSLLQVGALSRLKQYVSPLKQMGQRTAL